MEYLLSLIVPIYNGGKYITQLYSTIKEKNKEFFNRMEVIFVDDGSKDDSYHFLCNIQKEYPNSVLLHQENGGIASARNAGLSRARGKFIAFCDQDDSLIRGYEKFVHSIDDLECDLIITSYCTSDGKSIKFEYNELCSRNQVNTFARHMLAYGLVPYLEMPKNNLRDVSTVWNCIFNREFLMKHSIRFEAFVDYEDDWKFITECLVHANTVYLDKDGYYCWTVNPFSESHTHKYISNYIFKREQLIRWIIKQLSICGVDDKSILHYKNSPEINRSVIIDAFYNACSLNYKEYRTEIQVLFNNGWRVTKETIRKAKTKPQSILLTMLYLKMYGPAYFVNKYGLKRSYH